MTFLLRLRAGDFLLEDSVTLEKIAQYMDSVGYLPETILAPKELALRGMTTLSADGTESTRLRQGQSVWLKVEEGGCPTAEEPDQSAKACALDPEGRLAAIGNLVQFAEPDTANGAVAGLTALFKPDKTWH